MECLKTKEWVRFASGQLSKGKAQEVRNHLDSCKTCKAEHDVYVASLNQGDVGEEDFLSDLELPEPVKVVKKALSDSGVRYRWCRKHPSVRTMRKCVNNTFFFDSTHQRVTQHIARCRVCKDALLKITFSNGGEN